MVKMTSMCVCVCVSCVYKAMMMDFIVFIHEDDYVSLQHEIVNDGEDYGTR